jgi:hypothetical protein
MNSDQQVVHSHGGEPSKTTDVVELGSTLKLFGINRRSRGPGREPPPRGRLAWAARVDASRVHRLGGSKVPRSRAVRLR